jgi:3-hydroxyisobutyrate dehydrogenase-like beta-hydroxyacid dehydrogenase
VRGNFSPKGPIVLAVKDLGLSLETARQLGVVVPMGGLYHQLMLQAQYNGWDRSDATAVMRIYEELAGGITRKARKPPSRRKGR